MFLALAVAFAASTQAEAGVVVREKTANLDITSRVERLLRAEGLRVTLTRDRDRTLRPGQRTGLANRLGADAFVSIHNNASRSPRATGTELYRSIRADGSSALGEDLLRGFRAEFGSGRRAVVRTRRGCCGDYYYQLRNTRMASVLVEAAYVSDPSEGRALGTSSAFRQRLAEAIADGILRWQARLGGTPPSPDPGITVPAPLPPPLELEARDHAPGQVALYWRTSTLATSYRIYRDGELIGIRSAPVTEDLTGPIRTFIDRWASPGRAYTYLVTAVDTLPGNVSGESAPALATIETPPIHVVLDAGHGGRDPGAVRRYP